MQKQFISRFLSFRPGDHPPSPHQDIVKRIMRICQKFNSGTHYRRCRHGTVRSHRNCDISDVCSSDPSPNTPCHDRHCRSLSRCKSTDRILLKIGANKAKPEVIIGLSGFICESTRRAATPRIIQPPTASINTTATFGATRISPRFFF